MGGNKEAKRRRISSNNAESQSPPPLFIKVNKDIEDLTLAFNKLSDQVENKDVNPMIDVLCQEVDALKNSNTKSIIPMLIDCILKQQKQINDIKHELTDLKARSMRRNILLHNVKETKEEDLEKLLKDEFSKMGLDTQNFDIERVHRMGSPRSPDSNPRPVVAAMTSSKMTEKVLKSRPPFVRTKERKTNNGTPWISPHLPQNILDERKKLNYLADHYVESSKKDNKPVKISIKMDKLRVNNTLIKPHVNAPGIEDLLVLDDTDTEELKKFKFAQTNRVVKNTSTISGHKCTKPLNSHNMLNEAYKSFLLKPGMIISNTAIVYKLENGERGFACSGELLGRVATLVHDQMYKTKEFCLFLVVNGPLENIKKEQIKRITDKY